MEPDEVTVRLAVPGDAEQVARIWYRGWLDGHLGHVPDTLIAVRPEESFTPRAAANVARTSVAVRASGIVGFVTVADDELEQLYVADGARGSGVATVLLRAGEERIAAGGHPRAWLAVVGGNVRARRFYERSGWSDQGLFSHHAPGGVDVPAHRYVRDLGVRPRAPDRPDEGAP